MTIHVGLIGGGNISNTHARAVEAIPDAKVVAIYGENAEKVQRLSVEHGAQSYREFDAFLAHRPMEMVIIGSPSGLHATQGNAAARHGLHVLTEKPIDTDTARADALIADCAKAGVKLGVIFQDRFIPDVQKVKRFLDDGLLGRILLVDASVKWYRPPEYYSRSRWRGTRAFDGGGALINQGVHTVDLLLWLFGNVESVQAQTATMLHDIETEDTSVSLIRFCSGATGILQVTTAAYPGYPRRMTITGTEGTLVLDENRLIAADLRKKVDGLVDNTVQTRHENSSSPQVSDIRGHQLVIEDFIRAIRENGKPMCDGVEGRRSLALVQQIYKSCPLLRRVSVANSN